MGSTGSGHLSDYSNYKNAVAGVTGGKDTVYICDKGVATSLEDVETNDYFRTHDTVPPKGTTIVISFNTRMIAVDENGVIVGNLPTSYNYLLGCIEEGYHYEGEVTESHMVPFPSVSIAVTPKKA